MFIGIANSFVYVSFVAAFVVILIKGWYLHGGVATSYFENNATHRISLLPQNTFSKPLQSQ